MRPPASLACAALSLAATACLASAQNVPTPEKHLGRPLAADFHLPDWNEVRGYFEKLDRESPRVLLETVGKTTEGRDFLLAVVSSEANLARLPELKEHARILADPRGASPERRREAVEKGRVLLFVSCAMHATECAAPQFAMKLAHLLATSDEEPWRSARESCVLLLLPSTNPDGLDDVAAWYRRTVGTPYEAAELTELYQRYAGHDNNRDWFMLTQAETRIVTRLLYSVWRPHVYWDVHQQGSRSERMFVPPFRDPLNPNLDPSIVNGMTLLGTRALYDLTREGRRGVATGGTYDMWWNGGNRNVPVRHNIVGLLTEAASARLATPIFLAPEDLRAPGGLTQYAPSNRFPDPWPGGWWRIGDIVEYETAFARSVLGSLSRERATWLQNALDAADRAIAKGKAGAPSGWIVPADLAGLAGLAGPAGSAGSDGGQDRGAARRLADVLLAAGVELSVAEAPFAADGRDYPAGSIVIRRDQPYGPHVKDLFEVQDYPEGDPPYDVAGWTLPLLLGVRKVEVVGALDGKARAVATAEEAVKDFAADEASSRDSDAWCALFRRLAAGGSAAFDRKTGRFLLETPPASADPHPLPRLPRVGLYSPWSGSMDEGWARWVFETFELPYSTVRNEMLRAGALSSFLDVLVLPSVGADELDRGRAPGSVFPQFAGGLDPEGAVAVEEFVRGGGTLVAIGSSCRWAVELMKLPLVDVTALPENKDFSCPGSVVRTIPEPSPFTAGLAGSVAVFSTRSPAWREMNEKEREAAGIEKCGAKAETLLRYAPTRLLLSGWMKKPETVAGQAAWVRARHGEGAVHLFGFRPQYRGWSQAAFQLLFRAIVLEKRAP